MSIRSKLLVAFVCLALAPMTAVAVYGLSSGAQALRRVSAEHLESQLRSNVAHLSGHLDVLDAQAELLADRVEQTRALRPAGPADLELAHLSRLLHDFSLLRPDFRQVRVIAESGVELARVNRAGDEVHVVPASDLQDKSDRYYFREARALPVGTTYVSPIDLNVEHGSVTPDRELVFRVIRRLRDSEGRVTGMIVLNVAAERLVRSLEQLRGDPRATVLIAGAGGRFVGRSAAGLELGRFEDQLSGLPAGVIDDISAGGAGVLVEAGDRLVSYAPVGQRRPEWQLAIVYPANVIDEPVRAMRWVFGAFALVAALIALVLAGVAAGQFIDPLARIHAWVARARQGDVDQPLEVRTGDELEELAVGVATSARALAEAQARLTRWNDELQTEVEAQTDRIEALHDSRRELERRLLRSDRLASLGMLSASLAHEVGNPLAAIKTVIQVRLRERDLSEATRRSFELVLGEVDRLADVLQRITGYIRPAAEEPTVTTVRQVFDRVEGLLAPTARRGGVRLVLQGDGVDRGLVSVGGALDQVMFNLVGNALQAMKGTTGKVTVTAGDTAEGVELTVADEGPGVAPLLRERVFEPFFTTREGGTGLGLPIVRQLLDDMGGTVRLECPEEGGARVHVRLSWTPDSAAAPATMAGAA